MTTVLVSGSEGLIGKPLVALLRRSGIDVVEFDHKNASNDIADVIKLNDKITNCNGVVHLAAVSRVVHGQKNPEKCWRTNVVGTENVLQSALNSKKTTWVIYASSREVYGQQTKFPVIENAELNPMNVYAKSKKAAEELMSAYQTKGLNTLTLRFSNVYGSVNDHVDRVIPAFCRAAINEAPLKVEGFDHVFDFTHVMDVVKGIYAAILKLVGGERLPTMHFVSGVPTTLLQLAQKTCELTKSSSEIISAEPRNYDVNKFYGDYQLAQFQLDWSPTIALNEGLTQLIKQIKSIKAKVGKVAV